MRPLRLTLFLLKPSIFSAVICTLLTIVSLVITGAPFLANNDVLQRYFFGAGGLVTVMQHSQLNIPSFVHNMYGHMNRSFLSFMFILLLTIAVYTALETIGKIEGSVRRSAKEVLNAREQSKLSLLRELVLHIVLRVLLTAATVVYILFLVWEILPTCIALSRFGIGVHRWWDVVFAASLLFAALHVVVILVRFITLRPRVFGGVDETLLMELRR